MIDQCVLIVNSLLLRLLMCRRILNRCMTTCEASLTSSPRRCQLKTTKPCWLLLWRRRWRSWCAPTWTASSPCSRVRWRPSCRRCTTRCSAIRSPCRTSSTSTVVASTFPKLQCFSATRRLVRPQSRRPLKTSRMQVGPLRGHWAHQQGGCW